MEQKIFNVVLHKVKDDTTDKINSAYEVGKKWTELELKPLLCVIQIKRRARERLDCNVAIQFFFLNP